MTSRAKKPIGEVGDDTLKGDSEEESPVARSSDLAISEGHTAPQLPKIHHSKSTATLFTTLKKNIASYLPHQDLAVIDRAYAFAAHHHRHQTRKSGEPYIDHPLEVANILTTMGLDIASLIAAILHDTVEDTEATLEDVEAEFGEAVRDLVDGLTKISRIKFRSSQERLAENFRKMVMAMANDLRVILIKLGDRLHNMRTLDILPEPKRQRIAQETLDIYAPLANRLGIYNVKSELEDLCMRQLKIDIYREISRKVASKKTQRQAYIDEVRSILETELQKYGFSNLVVYGRPKHFYSIYKKMVERGLEFEDIHDLFAFRVSVDTVKDCYEALGVVHAMWKPMPGRFKDYIAMPKANLYQSLHTTVVRPNGEPAEIQIRTHDMHQTCEYGVAAHWVYKEKTKNGSAADLQRFSWLRQFMEWKNELTDPDEFLEAVKVDLFEEEIFVFTPKGDVIQLSVEATALDFAFNVHTEIGLTTIGAKVNGRMVPLKKQLKSGDIVEILTSSNQKVGKDWLNFVTTARARNKIRSHLRAEQRDRSRRIGNDLLKQELEHHGLDFDRLKRSGSSFDSLIKIAKESSLADVLVSIGYGKTNTSDLVKRAFAKQIKNTSQPEPVVAPLKSGQKTLSKRPTGGGILVHGIENVLVNFGKCCNPLPGENVVGFITRGRGVTVHRGSCPRALDMDPRRRIAASWADESEDQGGVHAAYLRVTAKDRQGVLAEVTSAIAACGANIQKAQIRVTSELVGVLDFEITLKSLVQLQSIIRKVEGLPGIVGVERQSTYRLNMTSE